MDEPRKIGFAAMDPDEHKTVASRGGKAVPAQKRGFARDRELAARAGKKGGETSRRPGSGG